MRDLNLDMQELLEYQHDPISELSSENKLSSNYYNYFLISKQNLESNIYSSRKIDFKNISDNVINTIEGLSTFNPTGKWTFHKGITINNRIVKRALDEGDLSCVVTVDLLSSTFMSVLTKLSNEIYVKNHIPSSVGDIIYSTNRKFRTEAGVKAFYGNYTSWEQITGRFIYGYNPDYASLSVIGRRGGESETELKISDIPNHIHKFVPENDSKTFTATCTLDAGDESQEVAKKGKYHARTRNGEVIDEFSVTVQLQQPDSCVKKGARIYGNKGADVTVKTNTYNGKPHNNMPPFHTVYIWKRIV